MSALKKYSCSLLLITAAVIIISFDANAQISGEIDNLIIELAGEESLKGKLALTIQLGEAYQKSDYHYKSIEYYKDALELEKEINNKPSANTNYLIGANYLHLNDPDKAKNFLQKAMSLSDDDLEKEKITRSLLEIARSENDFREAKAHCNQLITLSFNNDDNYGVAYYQNEMGIILQLQDSTSQANNYFIKSLKSCQKVERQFPALNATVLTNLGASHSVLGNYIKARDHLDDARRIWRELDNKPLLADAYNYLAANEFAYSRYQLALSNAKQAIDIIGESQNNETLLKSYQIMSSVYQAQGDWELYQTYFDKYQALNQTMEEEKLLRQQKQLEIHAAIDKKERLLRQQAFENESKAMALRQLELEQEKQLQALRLTEAALKNKALESQKLELQSRQQQQRLEMARQKALADKMDAEVERQKAIADAQLAETEKLKAEADKRRAEAQKQQQEKELTALKLEKEQRSSFYFRILLIISLAVLALIVVGYIQNKTTLNNLKVTQNKLVQSEKMAALGRLLSGISHEINSPLSAIKSNIEKVNSVKTDVLMSIINMAHELNDNEFKRFEKITRECLNHKSELRTYEIRVLTKQLYEKLARLNISNPEKTTELLADIELFEINEDLKQILEGGNHLVIFKAITQLKDAFVNLENSSEGVKKASNIMKALKAYTHHDDKDKKVWIDLGESIDLTLELLKHELQKGIEVIKDYHTGYKFFGNPDELGQIWSNIISNAIHAMDYKGVLTIAIVKKKNTIKIKFHDTGCGIDPADKEKIFDAFFTTKIVGKGSGLGLDIAMKSVKKHHGDITFSSLPGDTTFTVTLPNILKEEMKDMDNLKEMA
ncbi:MAG TPA: tetratricopeptide repeat protein [Cyclobacteriaceae bacterium]